MYDGEFRRPDQFVSPTMPEGTKHKISDIYLIKIDPEIVLHAGIIPGWKVPIITDGNPHQEGILDARCEKTSEIFREINLQFPLQVIEDVNFTDFRLKILESKITYFPDEWYTYHIRKTRTWSWSYQMLQDYFLYPNPFPVEKSYLPLIDLCISIGSLPFTKFTHLQRYFVLLYVI